MYSVMNSFKEIYNLYKHQVYFYVKKSIKNGDDIEDVTQEIFIHLWKHKDSLRNKNTLDSVIFKTCIQEISNFYRKNRVDFDVFDDVFLGEELDHSYDENLKEERIKRMNLLLDKLPDESKDMLVLNKVEKVSLIEIGEDYNLSKSAIEKRINKTIIFLRSNLSIF